MNRVDVIRISMETKTIVDSIAKERVKYLFS